jgi:hypothetical protein
MPQSTDQVLKDPSFQGLAPLQKIAILRTIDPQFAAFPPDQQMAIVSMQRVGQKPAAGENTSVWQAYPDMNRLADKVIGMEGRPVAGINNPGNLKSNGQLLRFPTPEIGRQALMMVLRQWQQQNPNMTIAEFNHKYAPDKDKGGDNPAGTEAGRNRSMLQDLGVSTKAIPPWGQHQPLQEPAAGTKPPLTLGERVLPDVLGGTASVLNPVNWVTGTIGEAKAQAEAARRRPLSGESLRQLAEGPGAIAIDPILRGLANAGKFWAWDVPRGNVPNAWQQIKSVTPTAVGTGIGQAIMLRGLGREPAGPVAGAERFFGARPAAEPPINTGSLIGMATRAKERFNWLGENYWNTPVDVSRTVRYLNEAQRLNQNARMPMPPAVQALIEAYQQNGPEITYQQSRDLMTGMKIRWEGENAPMNALQQQIFSELDAANTRGLHYHGGPGVATTYRTAMAQWAKTKWAEDVGVAGGHMAGYIVGTKLGRAVEEPMGGMLIGGHLGRAFLKPAAESMVGKITHVPDPYARLAEPFSFSNLRQLAYGPATRAAAAPNTAPFYIRKPDEGEP